MYPSENMTLRLLQAIQLARKKCGDGFDTPKVFIEFWPCFLTDHEIWAESHKDETFWHY